MKASSLITTAFVALVCAAPSTMAQSPTPAPSVSHAPSKAPVVRPTNPPRTPSGHDSPGHDRITTMTPVPPMTSYAPVSNTKSSTAPSKKPTNKHRRPKAHNNKRVRTAAPV